MELLALLVLPFAVVFGALAFAALWVIKTSVRKLVGERHQALEEIANTGKIPDTWQEPYQARMARLSEQPDATEKLAALHAKAERRYGRKLRRLQRYAERTTLVADEETRRQLLDRLADAQKDLLASDRK